jgi:glycogen debranching enzyme
MTHEEHTTWPAGDTRQDLSPQEQQERKQRVLTQGTPSIARSIADAVVAKDGDIYFLTEADGSVPLDRQHGFGLYDHDCRFLNGYELRLGATKPQVLASSEACGYMTVFQLTNTDLLMPDGTLMPKESIGIKWERVIDATAQTLCDVLSFENFGLRSVVLPLALTFHAGFEDVFAVRGLLPERLGQLWPAAWTDGRLSLGYDGSDGLSRSVIIHFIPQPEDTDDTTARFTVTLQSEERTQIFVSLVLAEARDRQRVQPASQHGQPDPHQVQAYLQASADEWLGDHTHITSDSVLLNTVLHRSLLDLRALRSTLASRQFFAAGVPWFVTLFGRDSLIAALQTLAYDPRMAEETLQLLAAYQGQRVDAYRDEQPGKILHELRIGEMTNTGEIPHSPYYGTVDATLLFLILLGRHAPGQGVSPSFTTCVRTLSRRWRGWPHTATSMAMGTWRIGARRSMGSSIKAGKTRVMPL